jgi:hypothetical protein
VARDSATARQHKGGVLLKLTSGSTSEPYPAKLPDQYLLVRHCCSGDWWIMPLRSNTPLDIVALVRTWIWRSFSRGTLALDGPMLSKVEGDFYATLYIDGRPPDSSVAWDSGGFYLKGLTCRWRDSVAQQRNRSCAGYVE